MKEELPKKIVFEHLEKREAVYEESKPLLKLIAELIENPGVESAMVTTLSAVGDFMYDELGDDLPAKLSMRLGFTVKADDHLWKVARLMAKK